MDNIVLENNIKSTNKFEKAILDNEIKE